MSARIEPADVADAFSDMHLHLSGFAGARVVGQGPDFETLVSDLAAAQRSCERVAVVSQAMASEPDFQTPHIASLARARRSSEATGPVDVDLETATVTFADRAHDFVAGIARIALATSDRVVSEFVNGATMVLDGARDGAHALAASIVSQAGRGARVGTVTFAFAAGFSGLDVGLHMTLSPPAAHGAEWSGPSETMLALAATMIGDDLGPEAAQDFVDESLAFAVRCSTDPSSQPGCKVEMPGVEFDFGADRYVVSDINDPASLVVVEDHGVTSVFDPAQGRTLDLKVPANADRVVTWMMEARGPSDLLAEGDTSFSESLPVPGR